MLLRSACKLLMAVIFALAAGLTWPQDLPPDQRAVGRRGTSPFEPVAQSAGNAAMFVGVNEFPEDESLAALSYAVNDAVALAHLFVLELKLIAPERAVLALSGEPRGETAARQLEALEAAGITKSAATKARIFRQLQRVCALPRDKQHLLLLSLSSHGFEEHGVAYVMPADGVRSFLADTAINLNSVERALASSPAGKRLLLLDACREKPLAGGRGGIAAMSAKFRTALAEAGGQAVLASCDVGQVSFEDPKLGHGIFTHYLLRALRGEAEADAQGLIRLEQVLQFVSREVENWSKRNGPQVQQPWFEGPEIARQIPLAVDTAAAEVAKQRLEKLRALALDDSLTIELFQEAERLLSGAVENDIDRQRAEIYVKLADGKTDAATARLALSKLVGRHAQATTLTVAADGTGQYLTIQEAMDAAQPGDTIMVRPGVYREEIAFRDGVRLIGTSATGCLVEPLEDAYSILIAADCSSGSIENLTFDGRGVKFHRNALPGITGELRDKKLWITKVRPGGPAAAAGVPENVLVVKLERSSSGDAQAATTLGKHARDLKIEVEQDGERKAYTIQSVVPPATGDHFPHGISLLESALEIRGCVVRGMGGDGVVISGAKSRVTIRESTFRKNTGVAIGTLSRSHVEIEDCVFDHNAGRAVYVHGENTTAVLTRNGFDGDKMGISFLAGAGGQAVDNRLENHEFAGITIDGENTAPILRNNECRGAKSYGIHFAQGAGGTAEGNVCEENGDAGIIVRDQGTAPQLKNNICRANIKYGVRYHAGAAGQAEQNECIANGADGILVYSAGSAPTLKNNKCLKNKSRGIDFGGGAAGRADHNVCEQNGTNGIRVQGPGTAPTLTGNNCRQNKQSGIAYFAGAGGRAEENTCSNNLLHGMYLGGESTAPTLLKNTCNANAYSGILYAKGAGGLAEDNTVAENTMKGIALDDPKTAPHLRRNRVLRNGTYGITVMDGAGGLLEANTCTGNKASGIAVHGAGTAPTLRENVCTENDADGIHYTGGAGGLAERNACERNKQAGIGVYHEQTAPRLSKNRCNNNVSWGIYTDSQAKPRVDRDNAAAGNKKGQINK